MKSFLGSSLSDVLEKSFNSNNEKIALIFENKKVTYQELDSLSNQLANFLISKGIVADSLVPICMDSGIEMIISIIGILKAGAAYVPIDPAYPLERIAYTVKDCNASIIITTSQYRPKLPSSINNLTLELDNFKFDPSVYLSSKPTVKIDPANAAVIIYTSGTTGTPNGVVLEHKNLINNLNWACNFFDITKNDIILQKASFCFDVSIWETLWPLIEGATIVILTRDQSRDVEFIKNIIELHQITAVHFVPTVLEYFLISINKNDCGSLRRVISSGETLTPFQIELFKSKFTNTILYNLYGPTETTIHSFYWIVPLNADKIEKALIGKPVDNTEFFILDERKELVPPGGEGDIYIGGTSIARGYLNKPDLTSQRFVYINLNGSGPKRFFKSGDRGRIAADGNLEFLGRIDDQVKVNGYRIELEDIECVIRNSGRVKRAVVLAQKNALNEMQVTAYVVLLHPFTKQDVWDYLILKLPEYMWPSAIKVTEAIPFTLNGKVDKKKLFQNSVDQHIIQKSPLTETEHIVMDIWKKLLNTDNISLTDSFFELGGNSLRAVQMLSQVKKITGKHISYLLLTQSSTFEAFIKLFDTPDLLKVENVVVPIKPSGSKPALYLINGGGIVDKGFFNLGNVIDKEQPVYGVQSNGFDNNGKLLETIEDIAAYYVNSIIKDNNGPYCLAGYSLGGPIAYEMAKQLKDMGKTVKILIMIDSVTRDPKIIPTKYTLSILLRYVGLNIYQIKDGLPYAFKYTLSLIKTGLEKIKKLNAETEEIIDNQLNVFKIHSQAYKNYVLLPYDGNIIVLRAKKIAFYLDDFKNLGWKPLVKQVKSIPVKGDHYTIFHTENVTDICKKIEKVLEEDYS